jgi:hypothetical protein
MFTGCSKEKDVLNVKTVETTTVKTEKGLLCFSGKAEFENIYNQHLQMSDSELNLWEKKSGFVSMRNIFNQIVEAENALNLPYEKMTPEQLQNATPPPAHSELYYKYLKSGFLKIQTYADGSESYTYNVINPSSVGYFNENGLLKIGDTIYQVTDKALKLITYGDFGKIDLLQKTNQSDKQNHIEVMYFQKHDKGLDHSHSSDWQATGDAYHSKRIRVDITYYTNIDPGLRAAFITYNVGVQCQQKNMWGNWVLCSTDTYIYGTWTSSFILFGIPPIWNSLSFSYPCSYTYTVHPNQINNFDISLNPFNGTTAPFPSSWVYHNPHTGYQFDRSTDVNITYNYTVSGFGNLFATVKWPY